MSEATPGAIQDSERLDAFGVATPLVSRNPLDWFRIFGPGAVIASLTIGAGELIFSSRGGALFGYRLLWFFALILLCKWALVFASARHIVLTGAHPFQRWMDLPGPRGWLPLVFFFLALLCFPIWVCFHAGTVGTLLSWLAGSEGLMHGAAHLLWGIGVLCFVLLLIFTGGYARLERLQIAITILMVVAVAFSLAWLNPDWLELAKGFFWPRLFEYPPWVSAYPDIAARPVWVETVTYVGVIGGSGYDYLAYASYLRDKGWGQAGGGIADASLLEAMAKDPTHPNRRWVRACLIDCTLSFLAVLVFTVVFVACGAIVLGPQHKVPSGTNLLALQAEFVTPIYAWLEWVYFAGAFLAMFGTLYGTIEVAPTMIRELIAAANVGQTFCLPISTSAPDAQPGRQDACPTFRTCSAPASQNKASQEASIARSRRWAVWWCGLGGLLLLAGNFAYTFVTEEKTPPGLVALLTPANLFTGVLACGVICLLNFWMEQRFLPRQLRMSRSLQALNLVGGVVFLFLGLKGYWDHGGWKPWAILAGTVAAGWVGAFSRKPAASFKFQVIKTPDMLDQNGESER
jgi:hypothetical protein